MRDHLRLVWEEAGLNRSAVSSPCAGEGSERSKKTVTVERRSTAVVAIMTPSRCSVCLVDWVGDVAVEKAANVVTTEAA
jgi:hypothetical protein